MKKARLLEVGTNPGATTAVVVANCGTTIDSPATKTRTPGGRRDRLDALVAELRSVGIEVYSADYNPFTQGDMWNIWVRWGNARLNITSTASARRHVARVTAVMA